MAQPIEIALCRVWDHKSMQTLRAAELGAYLALAHACLVCGLDPIPTDKPTRASLARIALTAWIRIEDRVMQALDSTMPVLRAAYVDREKVRKIRQNVAFITHDKLRLKRRAKLFVKREVHNFVQGAELSCSIIQPQIKSTKFRPTKADSQARTRAIDAQSKPVVPLSD